MDKTFLGIKGQTKYLFLFPLYITFKIRIPPVARHIPIYTMPVACIRWEMFSEKAPFSTAVSAKYKFDGQGFNL